MRIYTDTSVIGGCLDEEFEEYSQALLSLFSSGGATMILSDLTLLELESAPANVRSVLDVVPETNREYVEFDVEARNLALEYVALKVVGEANIVDAFHIAVATINRVDVLVSWNFRHIVNLQRIHGYNSVNLRYGYPMIEIRTPREVIGHEED